MLPFLKFNELEILAFALVFIRVSTFLVAWPVFSSFNVPLHAKVLLSIVITIAVFPVINRAGLGGSSFTQDIAWIAGKEALTGLCLGFLTRLFFFALAIGGNLIATSIGVANAQIFNPTMGEQSTTVETFYVTLGMLLFIALNGHHYFLMGLVQSFDAIPLIVPGTEIASSSGMTTIGALVEKFKDVGVLLQAVLEAGIKISAPVLVASFMLNVVMGVIGRAVPQVNVLLTSMPVNFLAGVLVMIMAIPALIVQLDKDIVAFTDILFKFMKG